MGLLLSADAGRNMIFGYHPSIKRSGYDLGPRLNFITSISADNEDYVWNDSAQNAAKEKWFRPSDVTIGTDGALYIADWYDPGVGGHQVRDLERGRVYRVAPDVSKYKIPAFDIGSYSNAIKAMENPNLATRYMAWEKLHAMGADAEKDLADLFKHSDNPRFRARAFWLYFL